ncbi:MAG: hypothetical protein ACKN9T_13390, partial [Candidatus Methylumidiphilus sp.]
SRSFSMSRTKLSDLLTSGNGIEKLRLDADKPAAKREKPAAAKAEKTAAPPAPAPQAPPAPPKSSELPVAEPLPDEGAAQ